MGTTIGATAAGDPTANCQEPIDAGGVFYTIVGTGASITLSTCNNGTAFDTKLFVYTGGCGTYNCVDGNDDAGSCRVNPYASTVTFNSVLGTSYLVFVTGFLDETGPFTLSSVCSTVTSTSAPAAQSQFSVWPNPVAGKSTLHVTLAKPAAHGTLILHTILGQPVSTHDFKGGETEMTTTGLSSGTYLLTLQVDGRAPSVRRVVVE
jgi:hypothetical protein